MTIEIWITFVITAIIILIIPGPTIIFVIGQSLVHGRKVGIPLSAGVVLGDATCILLSLLGLSTFLSMFSAAFSIVKFLGAAYLIYLGISMIKSNTKLRRTHLHEEKYNAKSVFRDVFLVNALNPKGIIFYSAFMPQFVNPSGNIIMQFTILGITFLLLAFANVIFYSLLAAQMNNFFQTKISTSIFNLSGGICLICAGLYAATVNQK